MPSEVFKEHVKNSSSFGQILSKFGLKNKGGNNRTLKRRLVEEEIDFSHIKLGVGANKGRKFGSKKSKEQVIEEFFIKDANCSRCSIKFYSRKFDLIPYKCECGNEGEWRGKPLSLQIDHINGVNNDNRLENLRFLCPNCHSQTETFAGKSLKKARKPKVSELNPLWRNRPNLKRRKALRPSKEELSELIKTVSDNAIRNWCKSYEINLNFL